MKQYRDIDTNTEALQSTDEFWDGVSWRPVKSLQYQVFPITPHRRPIESGWIKLSEQERSAVRVSSNVVIGKSINGYYFVTNPKEIQSSIFTHIYQIPPLEEESDPFEEAWQEHWEGSFASEKARGLAIWEAGREYEKRIACGTRT